MEQRGTFRLLIAFLRAGWPTPTPTLVVLVVLAFAGFSFLAVGSSITLAEGLAAQSGSGHPGTLTVTYCETGTHYRSCEGTFVPAGGGQSLQSVSTPDDPEATTGQPVRARLILSPLSGTPSVFPDGPRSQTFVFDQIVIVALTGAVALTSFVVLIALVRLAAVAILRRLA